MIAISASLFDKLLERVSATNSSSMDGCLSLKDFICLEIMPTPNPSGTAILTAPLNSVSVPDMDWYIELIFVSMLSA